MAESSVQRRQRSSNYTPEEKTILLSLIAKYKDIIENRKTDSCSWKRKEQAWKIITAEFNNLNDNKYRPIDSLKKCYKNSKKNIRKIVADHKMLETDDRFRPVQIEPDQEILLDIINENIAFEVNNKFVTELIQPKPEPELIEDSIDIKDNILLDLEEPQTEQFNETPQDAPQRIDPQERLAEAIRNRAARRRVVPITQQLASSKISKHYLDLAQSKQELVNLQIEMLRQEQNHRNQCNAIELEMKLIQRDILKEQLSTLKNSKNSEAV